jgi:hypothetical protein
MKSKCIKCVLKKWCRDYNKKLIVTYCDKCKETLNDNPKRGKHG